MTGVTAGCDIRHAFFASDCARMDLVKGGGHGLSRFFLCSVDGHLFLLRQTGSGKLETLERACPTAAGLEPG